MKKIVSCLLLVVMLAVSSYPLASYSEDLFSVAARLCEEGRYQEALDYYMEASYLDEEEYQALSLFASYYPDIYKNGTYDFSAMSDSGSSAHSAAVKIEKTYKGNSKYYAKQVYLVTEAILYVSIDDILNQGFHEKGVAFATQVDPNYNGPLEKEILSLVNFIAPGNVKADRSYFDLSVEEKAEIISYANGRYEYYDSLAGAYSGDMLTDTVFAETAEKYGLTVNDISMVWFDDDANEYYRAIYGSVPTDISDDPSPTSEPAGDVNASETLISDAIQLLSSAQQMLLSCDADSGLYQDIVETRQELLSILGLAQPSQTDVVAAMTKLMQAMAGLGTHNEEEQEKQKAQEAKVYTVTKETPYSVIIVTAGVSDGQIKDCIIFSRGLNELTSDLLTDEIKSEWSQAITEKGSADVDAITGATLSYSAAAVKEAVNEIIGEASSAAEATAVPASLANEQNAVSEENGEWVAEWIAYNKEKYGAMSHEEFMAAGVGERVRVVTYAQFVLNIWDGKICLFARSPDGPYYLYNMYGSEEQFSNLKYGTKILVTGEKEERATEIEIADATFEILADDMYMPNPVDVTEVGNESLFDYQNECVVFRGLTVGVQENGNAVYYRNDQDKTGHVYFSAVKDGMNIEFKVSCEHEDQKKKIYSDVENLQIDDVVDVVCYLYYYNYLPYPEVMAVQLSGSGDIVTDKATLVPVEASSFTPAPTATATPTAKPTAKPTQKPSSSTRFTNKYGTPTTKCAHPGCNNYIASSGDTNCCPAHSNRCAECGKYIDGDALYCLDCIKKAIGN